jgi:hypothetical protein
MSRICKLPMRTAACLLLVLYVGACSQLFDERVVRKDFQTEHPDYKIVSVGAPDGHGGSTVVSFFIRYQKPGDTREFWSDWAYETKNGKLELVGKGAEHLFSAEARH